MITTIVLVLIAILTVALFLGMLRGRGAAVSDISDVRALTRRVDLLAFRNLIDPDEEEYLRKHLPSREFRTLHRERLRAALDYLDCVAGNAALLLRFGEAARRSHDPQVVAAGQELVDSALRVRVQVLLVQSKLYAGILVPGLRISPPRISDSYEHLTATVGRLGRLQKTPQATRVLSTL